MSASSSPVPPRTWQVEITRIAIAAAVGLLLWGTLVGEGTVPGFRPGDSWRWWDFAMGSVAVGSLIWRRRYPLQVAIGTSALAAGAATANGASLLALLSVCVRLRPRDIALATVAAILANVIFGRLHPDPVLAAGWEVSGTVILVAIVALAGMFLGLRRRASLGDTPPEVTRAPRTVQRWAAASVPLTGRLVWAETWRMVVAAIFGVVVISTLADTGQARGFAAGHWWIVVDVIVGLTAVTLLPLRHRWPLAIALVTAAFTAVSATATGAAYLATVSLSTRRQWREISVAVAALIAAGKIFAWVHAPTSDDSLTDLIISVVSVAFLVALGLFIGARRELVSNLRERAETAEREQGLLVQQARTTERARIAREMHDVLAHRMSLVAMHAGALAYRDDLPPEQVRKTATLLQETSHEALTDLRQVLGVLRDPQHPDGDLAAPEPPQPTLADLDDLLTAARGGGQVVTLTRSVDTALLPDLLSRNAYRIVQEALTNARKHAPGAPVSVSVEGARGAALELVVRNAMPAAGSPPSTTPGSGYGLVGLRERATLTGGTLTAGPDRSGTFVVRATLPWPVRIDQETSL